MGELVTNGWQTKKQTAEFRCQPGWVTFTQSRSPRLKYYGKLRILHRWGRLTGESGSGCVSKQFEHAEGHGSDDWTGFCASPVGVY